RKPTTSRTHLLIVPKNLGLTGFVCCAGHASGESPTGSNRPEISQCTRNDTRLEHKEEAVHSCKHSSRHCNSVDGLWSSEHSFRACLSPGKHPCSVALAAEPTQPHSNQPCESLPLQNLREALRASDWRNLRHLGLSDDPDSQGRL